MKTIRIFMFMLIIPMCLGLGACSEDDSSTATEQNPLIGTWEETYMSHGENVTVTLTINSDGTYSEIARVGSMTTLSEHGTYTYNSSTKVFVLIPTTGRTWTYFVLEVSDHSLVLMASDYSGTTTYKKI